MCVGWYSVKCRFGWVFCNVVRVVILIIELLSVMFMLLIMCMCCVVL